MTGLFNHFDPAARKPFTNAFGDQEWLLQGKRHRENDLPAVISAQGDREWYQHGKRHRDDDKPAYIGFDGEKCWYQHGKLHRANDSPAIEFSDGGKAWYANDQLHRDNGPAVVYADPGKAAEYWVLGCQLSEKEHDRYKADLTLATAKKNGEKVKSEITHGTSQPVTPLKRIHLKR